jgi:Tol biopolymer transport system component
MDMRLDTIRAQLDRICAGAEFARSERMVRFLRFVVEQSLQNGTESLRERQIGIDIFDRPHDWDPKLDNVVRSEARRLRNKLDAYAANQSPEDTYRITVPKGGYFAEFIEIRSLLPATQVANTPVSELSSPVRSVTWIHAAIMLACIAIVAATLLFAIKRWRHVPVRASEADTFEVVPFSNEIGQQFSPSVSPDGSRIAYVWDGNGNNFDIYIKQLSSGVVSRITTNPAADIHPAWSPNGQQIAFLRQGKANDDLLVKTLPNGSERVLAHVRGTGPLSGWASNNSLSGCQSLTWSSDGQSIVLADSLEGRSGLSLVTVDLNSGAEQALTLPPTQDEDCYPRVSPNGDRIAFVRYISHGVSEIFTIQRDGSGLKQLTQAQTTIRGLDWTADGERLIYASQRRGSYELRDVSSRGGDPHPIPADTNSASDPAVARDGRWMAFVDSTENWNIWRVSIHGGRLGKPDRLLASAGHNHSPSVSPDCKLIGFISDRSGTPEIWFANVDGSNLRQMTHFGGPWLGTIRWSPDSKAIVFDARPNGHSGIFTLPVSGGRPTALEQDAFEERRPFWSRDGKFIYFDTTRAGQPQIWKRNLQTGVLRVVEARGFIDPQETLDGKAVFFSNNTSDEPLWRSDVNGVDPLRIDALRADPLLNWSVGANGIYFTRAGTDFAAFFLYSFRNGSIQELGRLPQVLTQGTPSLVVSPNGQWLLYASIDHVRSDIKLRRTLAADNEAR